MRKIAYIVLLIMMSLLFPGTVCADSYTVNDEELTISFDDPSWVVFTRDNLHDNEQLKNLGTDEKTMLATMEKSYAYVVAVKGGAKKRIELLVRVTDNEYINNMNTLSESEMAALKEGVDENYSGELDEYEGTITEMGEQRYVQMTGRYDKDDYDVVQYLTFVNGKNYLISAQKVIEFTAEDLEQIDEIVKSAEFQIDPSKTENDVDSYVKERQASLSSGQKSTPVKIAITVIVVVVIILLLKLKNRRRK